MPSTKLQPLVDERLAKLQPLIAEHLKVAEEAAGKRKWGEAAKAAAKVLKMDPDHAGAQELKRCVFWWPLPEKTSGNLRYKEHPTDPVCAIIGVDEVDRDAKTVVLPTQIEGRSVVRIGNAGFAWGALTSVTIPSSVTSIGDMAFAGCWYLANLSVAAGNPFYQADDGVLFTKGGKTLIKYPESKPGETYTIPPSVTRIGDYAFNTDSGFHDFFRLKSVTIPSSVTSIGEGAFDGCCSLTSVTIPPGVTRIGDYAFRHCDGLKSVTIPSGVTSIGKEAFEALYIIQL